MSTHKNKKDRVSRLSYRAAADKLGVDFGHLRRVVVGERSSKRLLQRYRALIAGGAR